MVKNLPAMQETWVQSLGREDPLERGRATQSSILARRIPWTEEPGKLQSMGLQRVDTTEVTEHTNKCPFLLKIQEDSGILSADGLLGASVGFVACPSCVAMTDG